LPPGSSYVNRLITLSLKHTHTDFRTVTCTLLPDNGETLPFAP